VTRFFWTGLKGFLDLGESGERVLSGRDNLS
jgi:hypothetical protein